MLAGRETEQRTIGTLLAGARMGDSHVLVLTGDPGIGKTALLTEAASMAGSMRMLRVQATEAEQQIPFAGLFQLLRPILDLRERIPRAQQRALSTALLLGGPADDDPGTVGPQRFAIGAATLNLITMAAEDRPTMIIIDDAHLLDESSAEAITFVARRFAADAVALLAGVRSGAPGGEPWLSLPVLPIGGIDLPAAKDLIGDLPIRPDQLLRWHRLTGGNPLALLELRDHVDELDAVPEDFPVAVSDRLSRAFAARVAGFSDSGRTALLLAAADCSSAAAVYAACHELGVDEHCLGEAIDADLLRIHHDQLRFRHPLIRSAVYGAATPQQRRAAHRALARVLGTEQVHRLAWHLAASAVDPDETTAAALADVAARAAGQGAHAVAANAYERAAALSAQPTIGMRRLVEAADAAWSAGQPDRTLRLVNQAIGADPPAPTRIHLYELRGAVESRAGRLDHALLTLLDAAELIMEQDPAASIRLLSDAIHVAFYLGTPEPARLAADRIDCLTASTTDAASLALGRLASGMALIIAGDGARGTGLIRSTAGRVADSEELRAERFRMPLRVQSALWMRESGPVREFVDAAIEDAREQAALGSLPYLLMHIGRDAATSDRWSDAEAAYLEGIRLARETGQSTDLAVGQAGMAWLYARRGQSDRCLELISATEPIADERRIRLASFWLTFARGDLAAGLGRPDEAVEHYRLLQSWFAETGFADPDQWCVPELIECERHLGRDVEQDELSKMTEDFVALTRAKGQPWSLARGERTLALRDEPAAEPHFEAALQWHAKSPDAYETARTELAYGAWLRRNRRRTDARPHLRRALDIFDRLGATPWADTSSQELTATGATVRRRTENPVDQLTPQERQIAQLLASGRTTREAAAALFVSPKTVEYHLRHVYAKLGIGSRTELAARMAG
ncbi:AAA family ATPase [Microlunatus elymi]|uniref:AAA family ATPase n=1 Tax=Microlunatus elymi TaxID=2596828 RepID=A0A516Q3Z4_9ACTN|nr:LuxR family transcriptional regulator [Microlunatus elymi]QDP98148.1 AAA family ATPase [Microlunatus elymi]